MKTPFQAATSSGSASISARADSTVMISSESIGTSAASMRSASSCSGASTQSSSSTGSEVPAAALEKMRAKSASRSTTSSPGSMPGSQVGKCSKTPATRKTIGMGPTRMRIRSPISTRPLLGGGLAEQDWERLLSAGVAEAAQGGDLAGPAEADGAAAGVPDRRAIGRQLRESVDRFDADFERGGLPGMAGVEAFEHAAFAAEVMGDLVDRDASRAAHAGQVDRDQRQRSDGPELDSGPETAATIDLLRAFGGEQERGRLDERDSHFVPLLQLFAANDQRTTGLGHRGHDGGTASGPLLDPGAGGVALLIEGDVDTGDGRHAGPVELILVLGAVRDGRDDVFPIASGGILEACGDRP